MIITSVANKKLVTDVTGASTANGARVQLYSSNDTNAQTPANYVDTPATGTSLRIRRAGSVPLVSISKHNLTQGPDGMLALLAIEESQAPLHVPDSGSGIIAFLAHILIVCRL